MHGKENKAKNLTQKRFNNHKNGIKHNTGNKENDNKNNERNI